VKRNWDAIDLKNYSRSLRPVLPDKSEIVMVLPECTLVPQREAKKNRGVHFLHKG
jgi:hypothetical protein